MRNLSLSFFTLGLYTLFILGYFWLADARLHKTLYYITLISALPLIWQARAQLKNWLPLFTTMLAAYPLYQIISLSWSSSYSLQELGEVIRKSLLTLSFVGLSAFAITQLTQKKLQVVLLSGLVLSAALGIALWLGGQMDAMHRLASLGRAENANAAGSLLGIVAISFFALLLSPTQKAWRWALAAGWALAIVALLLTQSRGALLAAVVAHGVLLALSPKMTRKTLMIFSAMIVAITIIAAPLIDWLSMIERLDGHRFIIWQQALSQWQQAPLTGLGYRTPFEMFLPYGETIYQVHSIYMKSLMDGGLVGLALLLMLLVGSGAALWPYRHKKLNGLWLALLANSMIFGFVDYDILLVNSDIVWLLFWLPIAGSVAAILEYKKPKSDENFT